MNLRNRNGEGSSLAMIVFVSVSVLLASSVAYVTKNAYDENARSTKIVNELSTNNPDIDNLKSLGFIDATKVSTGSEVTMVSVDGITGIKEIRITNAETGAIVPMNVKGLEFDVSNVSYADGTATVRYATTASDGESLFAQAGQVAQIIKYAVSGLFDKWAKGATVTGCSGKTAIASSTGSFSFGEVDENVACNDVAITPTNWSDCSVSTDGSASLTGNVSDIGGTCIEDYLKLGACGQDSINDMDKDASGNLYVVGTFNGGVSAVPVGTVYEFSGATLATPATEGRNDDVFVAKIGSDGKQKWIKTAGVLTNQSNDSGLGISVDQNGDIWVVGTTQADTTANPFVGFDGLSTTFGSYANAFIARLDSNGSQERLDFFESNALSSASVLDVDTDSTGNVFVLGTIRDTNAGTKNVTDFYGSPLVGIQTASSRTDVFVQKYNSSLQLLWTKKLGGNQNDSATSIFATGDGNVLVSGNFANDTGGTALTLDFDGIALLGGGATATDKDAFVAKLSGTDGDQLWIKTYNAGTSDSAGAVYYDGDGNVYAGTSVTGKNYMKLSYLNGSMAWGVTLPTSPLWTGGQALSIISGSGGGTYVGGNGNVFEFDMDGNALFQKSGSGLVRGIADIGDGSVKIAGLLQSNGGIYTGSSTFEGTPFNGLCGSNFSNDAFVSEVLK